MFKQKSVALVIILSIVTCGIYALVWYWGAINDLYKAGGKSIGNLEPVIQFVLLFFYVGEIFFGINAADNLNEIRAQKGLPAKDDKVLYVVFSLICPIVTMALVQNEMNNMPA